MKKVLFLFVCLMAANALFAQKQILEAESSEIDLNIRKISDEIPANAGFFDPDQIQKGTFYALIIGISDYEDPNVNDLKNPVKDAQKLKEVLTQKYNFENKNVHFLPNSTYDQIEKKLEFFKANLKENDVWLIFFAGHGFFDSGFGKEGEGYWILQDSKKNSRRTCFSNSDLKSYVASVPNQHTLIIADACFAGALVRTTNFMEDAGRDIKAVYKDKSRKAMTSGSLEAVPDQSVFFESLIEELEKNEEPYLRASTLFGKVEKLVFYNSKNKAIFEPIHDVGHKLGDFVFIRK